MSRLQCIGVDGEGGCGRRSRGGRETCDKCTFARLTRCLSEMLIAADRLNGKHHCARCPVGPDDPHPEYNPECHLRRTAEDARSLLFGDGS